MQARTRCVNVCEAWPWLLKTVLPPGEPTSLLWLWWVTSPGTTWQTDARVWVCVLVMVPKDCSFLDFGEFLSVALILNSFCAVSIRLLYLFICLFCNLFSYLFFFFFCLFLVFHVSGLAVRCQLPERQTWGSNLAFPGLDKPVTWKLALQWLPCQVPGVIGSVLGLVGLVSV